MKRILCVLLIVAALFGAAGAEGAKNLLILGDSIATGYGLSGYSAGKNYSCSNFGMQLARAGGLTVERDFYNFAVDGMDTEGLYNYVALQAVYASLSSSSDVIISIGANDILGMGLEVMKVALGLKPDAGNDELTRAINATPNAMELITKALIANKARFTDRASGFSDRFAKLMTRVRQANPNAKIYLLSLYNPLSIPYIAEAAEFLDEVFYPMIAAMNAGKTTYNYTLLPVGELFRRNTSSFTNIGVFDVHPSQAGHSLIFRLASSAMGFNGASSLKSVNIKKSSLKLAAGGTAALKAVVKPASAGEAVWSSANEAVATVDEAGNVVAIGAGVTYIKASMRSNPRVSDTCKITVTGANPTTVSFAPSVTPASNIAAKNGAIEIIPAGGGGAYDISLDGGTTFVKTGAAGKVKLAKLARGEYAVLVRDAKDAANFAQKRVIVGYKLPKPRLYVASAAPVRLNWDGMGDSYEVWRQTPGEKTYEIVCVCEELNFTDTDAEKSTAYRYKVRAIGPDGAKSAFSNAVKAR